MIEIIGIIFAGIGCVCKLIDTVINIITRNKKN